MDETVKYLKGLGVAIEDVRQARFRNLDIEGTPTLILVDQDGRVESKWLGKLSPQREVEVFRAIGVKDAEALRRQ